MFIVPRCLLLMCSLLNLISRTFIVCLWAAFPGFPPHNCFSSLTCCSHTGSWNRTHVLPPVLLLCITTVWNLTWSMPINKTFRHMACGILVPLKSNLFLWILPWILPLDPLLRSNWYSVRGTIHVLFCRVVSPGVLQSGWTVFNPYLSLCFIPLLYLSTLLCVLLVLPK